MIHDTPNLPTSPFSVLTPFDVLFIRAVPTARGFVLRRFLGFLFRNT